MVSGLSCSKNLSKMKLQKSNGKSKRSRCRAPKDQSKLSVEGTAVAAEIKIKSGSWKRKSSRRKPTNGDSLLQGRDTEQAPTTSAKFRAGTSYSDVLFSGDLSNTVVKVRSPTPQPGVSHAETTTSVSDRGGTDFSCSDEDRTRKDNPHLLKNPDDLAKCTEHLMKRLNIEIPSWNFTKFGNLNEIPKFACHFDDYNYLACEKVASAGLRLASDGKFKF